MLAKRSRENNQLAHPKYHRQFTIPCSTSKSAEAIRMQEVHNCRLGSQFLEKGLGWCFLPPALAGAEEGMGNSTRPTLPASLHCMQNRGSTFWVGGKLRSGTGELAGFPLWFLASQSSVGFPVSPVRKGWLPSASSSAEGSGRVGVRSCVLRAHQFTSEVCNH